MQTERRRRSDGWSVVNKLEQVTQGVQRSLVCCSALTQTHTQPVCLLYSAVSSSIPSFLTKQFTHRDSAACKLTLARDTCRLHGYRTFSVRSEKSKTELRTALSRNKSTLHQKYTHLRLIWQWKKLSLKGPLCLATAAIYNLLLMHVFIWPSVSLPMQVSYHCKALWTSASTRYLKCECICSSVFRLSVTSQPFSLLTTILIPYQHPVCISICRMNYATHII